MELAACRKGRVLAAGALALTLVAPAAGQEPLASVRVDRPHDTGEVWNESDRTAVVISFPVLLSQAEWLRLYFERIELGDALLRITAYEDGEAQELRARHCVEWQNSSCYFNGCCVQVEVEAPPRSGPYRLVLSHVEAGEQTLPPASQCGPTDDRELSNDPRVCRIVPVGCTGWLIDDRNRGLLSAGHCVVPGQFDTVWFNVPLSDASGVPQMPSPDDQYPIDPASIQWSDAGIGDDWVYFGVFANANTGLSAGRAQGWCAELADPPAGGGHSVEVTGHGRDSTPPERNAVQQAHTGPLVSATQTTLEHQADTEGGNSGSPIIWTQTGEAIGIHTNGGCDSLGYNSGTARTAPPLLAALASPQGVCREPKLLASDGAAYDFFGYAVSVSGDTALVGAAGDNDNGIASGSAYVFVRSGTSWTQEAKLVAGDGAPADRFGVSVSLSGDTALVGAFGDDDNGSLSGSAYVFVRNGGTWTWQAKLVAIDGWAGDLFGVAVSVSGDTALVGAHEDGDNGYISGSAYVFVRSGSTWTQQAKFLADDGAAGDEFGHAVSVSGDTALVGAFGDGDNGSLSGSAYVFVRNGGTWTQQAKLLASDGAVGDAFGYAVSVSGDTALVGAGWDDDNGTNSGSAYVLVRNGGTWAQQAKLLASDGAAGDGFGIAVSVSGDTALVGADWDDDNGSDFGSAYVFVRDGGTWTWQAKLLASDGAAGDQFGRAVSVSGDTALVGAHLDDDNGYHSGSAYVFSLPCNTARIYCTSQINSQGCLPAIRFSGTPSLTVASPFELIATSVVNQQLGILFYGTAGPTSQPFGGGTLCVLPPIRRTPVQNSGGQVGPSDCSGVLRFDFNAWLREGNDPALEAGTRVWSQYWYRDPQAPSGTGLTNAVEFELLP